EKAAPTLTLNRHCSACEFRKDCLALAEETDDLSLLRCLSEKEILAQRRRGVTTLTQLSYTYRPSRRGKRRARKGGKHDPALQALALREKKVYVMDAPVLPDPKVALYLAARACRTGTSTTSSGYWSWRGAAARFTASGPTTGPRRRLRRTNAFGSSRVSPTT